jgi:O-antigen ligase
MMLHKSKLTYRLFVKLVISSYIGAIILCSQSERLTIIPKFVGIIAVIIWVYYAVVGKDKFFFPLEFKALIFWMFLTGISCVFGMDQSAAFFKYITLLQVFLITFAFCNLIVWSKSLEFSMASFVFFVVISSVWVSLNIQSYSTSDGRVFGTLGNSNLFGLALLASLGILIYFIFSVKSLILKLLLSPVVLFCFNMLLETGSRKGVLGGIVLVILMFSGKLFFLSRSRQISKALAYLAIAFFGVVSAGTYIVSSKHYHRIERLFKAVEDDSMSGAGISERGRLDLIDRGVSQAFKDPVLGIGLDNFRNIDGGLMSSVGTYSHSNYIEIMVSTGLLGFLLFYLFHYFLLLKIFRLRKMAGINERSDLFFFVATVIIVHLMYDFAMVSYYEKVSWLVVSFVVVGVHSLLQEIKKSKVQRTTFKKSAL